MENITIILFALSSFFGIESGKIVADKTTVTIYPETQQIKIIQEHLFTVIQSERDKTRVLEQWNKLSNRNEKKMTWSEQLDNFTSKNLTIKNLKETIQVHITLTYTDEKALQTMGIWHNSEKNQFSINHVPQYNIKTKEGYLKGNYWVFDGTRTLSFTIEPFLQMQEQYKTAKLSINKLVKE